MMKVTIIAALALLFSALNTNATALTWETELHITDSGSLTGTYDYDADNNVYSNVNISAVDIISSDDVVDPATTFDIDGTFGESNAEILSLSPIANAVTGLTGLSWAFRSYDQ